MISYICGKLTYKDESRIILEANGIGYDISISLFSYQTLPIVGEDCKVYTNMIVREDGISLVGFSTTEEKTLFDKLITVSGVGPKLALCVLSGINYTDLVIAILKEDANVIAKIKGVGKKTSERIILELKDKMMGLDDVTQTAQVIDVLPSSVMNDAIITLMSLGMNKNDATNLIKSVAGQDDTVESLITKALKGMN